MSRTLFDVGAQGPLIIDLQLSLNERGFDPKASDGIYGKDTAAAVGRFQTSVSHPATGAVTDDLWTAITGAAVPDVEARALQLTSTFEGHGYGLAEGNWDGAWLTWGIIGFTLKHGEVQSIVSNIARQAPACIDGAFGAEAARLLKIIAASPAEQEAWATSIGTGSHLAEPWRTGFQRFGSFPEVQAEQRARVHHDYFMPALRTAAALRLSSELGIALCFDIHVQNGSVSAGTRDAIARATPSAPELTIREALANAVADRAKPQFQDDVRARKMAIARGQGVVHGRRVVLATWGLDDTPAVVA
jgi:hypothetical protein